MITRLLFIASIAFISACASTPPVEDEPQWAFTAKFSLRSAAKNQSGYIEWQHYDTHYAIKLWGNFGLGTTKIYGNGSTLTIDNGKTQHTINDESELLPELSIPIAAIANNAERLLRQCNASEQPLSDTSPWRVKCEREASFDGVQRPKRISASNTASTFILVFKTWS